MGNFNKLGVSNELEDNLLKRGISEPTTVQERTIPYIVKGRDVIVGAQTGTGKTLTFLLPLIDKIDEDKASVQGLIITPTRELAIQITEEAKKLVKDKNINILAAYGGQDVERQLSKLKSGVHLIIATPGRLLDHMRRKNVDLGKLRTLVLDEADEILHMGFLEEVEQIIASTPKTRQTMLFSATMPNEVRNLGKRFMKDIMNVEIEGKNVTLDEIEQVVIEVSEDKKTDTLCRLIDEYRPYLAIVFAKTKKRVSELNLELLRRGYNSDELQGDMSQAKRERVMKDFRTAKLQILVATDIAARGIDVEGVTHVINYDIPDDVDSYIHRIGRTGRIGHLGMAITLATPRNQDQLALLERKIKKGIRTKKMDSQKNEKKSSRISKAKSDGNKTEKKPVDYANVPKKYRPKKYKRSF